jgi:hypothetical protein
MLLCMTMEIEFGNFGRGTRKLPITTGDDGDEGVADDEAPAEAVEDRTDDDEATLSA